MHSFYFFKLLFHKSVYFKLVFQVQVIFHKEGQCFFRGRCFVNSDELFSVLCKGGEKDAKVINSDFIPLSKELSLRIIINFLQLSQKPKSTNGPRDWAMLGRDLSSISSQ